MALQTGKPDADPFDLLCRLAFNAPVLTRRRAVSLSASNGERVGVRYRILKETAFLNYLGPEVRELLNDLLEKYPHDGEAEPVLFGQIESSLRPAKAINASRFPSPTCMLPPCLLH